MSRVVVVRESRSVVVVRDPSIVTVAAPGIQGPVGPVGPEGPVGPPGDPGGALAYTYTSSSPTLLHQIVHNLPFKPAGIVCQEADGSPALGWSVSHPSPGITEVSFGAAFTGTIFLS